MSECKHENIYCEDCGANFCDIPAKLKAAEELNRHLLAGHNVAMMQAEIDGLSKKLANANSQVFRLTEEVEQYGKVIDDYQQEIVPGFRNIADKANTEVIKLTARAEKAEARERMLREALERIQHSGTGREDDGTISMTMEAMIAKQALGGAATS